MVYSAIGASPNDAQNLRELIGTAGDIFPKGSGKGDPEPFHHQKLLRTVTYFSTTGYHLREARTPRELIEIILHAMIAHYILWRKHDILHRDISSENILKLPTPVERKLPETPDFSMEALIDPKYCKGVLIDGGVAVDLKKHAISGKQFSATWAFLSLRLSLDLDANLNSASAFPQPSVEATPFDDLEASIWVILHECWAHGSRLGQLRAAQQNLFQAMKSDDRRNIIAHKKAMVETPVTAMPQWPRLNDFVAASFRIIKRASKQTQMDETLVSRFYQGHFVKLRGCIDDSSIVNLDWAGLYAAYSAEKSAEDTLDFEDLIDQHTIPAK